LHDYAGGLGDFTCEACGREGIRYRRGACGNCVLAERVAVLLDDGTGRIRPELAPFAAAFCQMRRPRGGITWLGRPHVQKMLRTLADPGTPVTHETLNGMSPWRSVAYLRDLLMLGRVGYQVGRLGRVASGCPVRFACSRPRACTRNIGINNPGPNGRVPSRLAGHPAAGVQCRHGPSSCVVRVVHDPNDTR
jgi:hypothetical protein